MSDWYAMKDALWNALEARFGYPGLAFFEQVAWRSYDETRCHECGDPGTAPKVSKLAAAVPHYWLCSDCNAYWQGRTA